MIAVQIDHGSTSPVTCYEGRMTASASILRKVLKKMLTEKPETKREIEPAERAGEGRAGEGSPVG